MNLFICNKNNNIQIVIDFRNMTEAAEKQSTGWQSYMYVCFLTFKFNLYFFKFLIFFKFNFI